jgi:hypothetical protein
MKIKNLFEKLERTGESKGAVLGWGRGMGHKGHMFLASSVITHASDLGADPYFVVSRTVGKDDPITPEEKLEIYKKVFPEKGHIFHTATEEMPDLTKVLAKLQELGYDSVTVVVGADQKKALSYVLNYNGKEDKQGNIPFSFKELNVISRQETSDPSREEEGPRATPMRDILKDPVASDDEKFAAWRAAMNPELSDDEVRDLMNKASQRMSDFDPKKKSKVGESVGPAEFTKTVLTEVRSIIREMRNDPYIAVLIENAEQDKKDVRTLKESDDEENYYYRVRHQTEKDIELEMPSKAWDAVGPKYATYEEAKAAYENLKNKHTREKFTVTRHPRTSYVGGSPSQQFPEGVAESKPKGYDSDGNPQGGGWDEYINDKKSWTVVVDGKTWKTFDDERQAYKAADAIQRKYGKKTRVVSESITEGKIKINIKHPPETAQEKLYKKHQELRKKSGLPDPSEYKKKAAEKQKEIDDMKEAKESEPPKPRNFVAKNAKTAGAGAHKDKKKQEKQGDVKHKAKAIPMDESRWGPARKKYSGI